MLKDIPGYEGLYQVSDDGRVWNVTKSVWLKSSKSNTGYLVVHLRKNKQATTHSVHRLVAMAFIPNRHCRPQVNHINENKTDNRAENLEWVTARENLMYGSRLKRAMSKISRQCFPVEQLSLDDNVVKRYPSLKEASRQTGLSAGNISACTRGKKKTTGGYKWRLVGKRL
jgi:hypothetical protein